MSTILITGGAGSIGRELARVLTAKGHLVRALDLPSCDFAPLEALPNVEPVRADILDRDALMEATDGVDAALHLAALLPPQSERDGALTWRVNVEGTQRLIEALEANGRRPHLILSSSVCVYGDTWAKDPSPSKKAITVDHPCAPFDRYGESKVAAESAVRGSALPYTILRISGVAVPAFLAPPEVWPFLAEQRIEFVARDDVVTALAACVGNEHAIDRTLHVAGGPTWRMTGAEYAARFNEVLGLDADDAVYCPGPCAFDTYDTTECQAILGYQRTSFAAFLEQLQAAVDEALT
jgi:nucleoside-diphosphate-sugar epimerase